MPTVLYLHGFASSPASAKITALRPLLAPRGIELNTPDLNVPSFEQLDFDAVVDHAYESGRAAAPSAIVGSSLGALVALGVVRRGLALPLVLIAPALGVAKRWSERVPDEDPVLVFNHARGGEAPIHRLFFRQMAVLDIDEEPPPARVTLLMGREDETVPFAIVEETWARWCATGRLVEGSSFIAIEDGDHALTDSIDVIAGAIAEAAR